MRRQESRIVAILDSTPPLGHSRRTVVSSRHWDYSRRRIRTATERSNSRIQYHRRQSTRQRSQLACVSCQLCICINEGWFRPVALLEISVAFSELVAISNQRAYHGLNDVNELRCVVSESDRLETSRGNSASPLNFRPQPSFLVLVVRDRAQWSIRWQVSRAGPIRRSDD